MTTMLDERLAGAYTLDAVHSTANFSVKHMVVSTFRGRFEEFDAELRDGVFVGTVQADSIVVKDEKLKGHLTAPDFFDSEQYPTITYRSTEVKVDGDQVTMIGELTIKDKTESVTTSGTIAGPHADIRGNTKIGLALEATIDRRAFGLDWNMPLKDGGFALGNDVRLAVELELVRT